MPLVPTEILDLKRRTVHVAYGILALLSGSAVLYEAAQLRQRLDVNEVIASMPERLRTGTDVVSPADPHEVMLARAAAQAGAGNLDAAAKTYSALIASARMDAAGRAALFDLANLYLRQGIGRADDSATVSLPMLELAKQRYRDLLKVDPNDWDGRFNLERALRLAPEVPAVYDDTDREPVDRRKMMAPELLAPELP